MSFTRHGHHIPGTILKPDEEPLSGPQLCGGPNLCALCMLDAHNALRQGPIIEIPVFYGDVRIGTGKLDPSGTIYLAEVHMNEVGQGLLKAIDLGDPFKLTLTTTSITEV